MPGDDLNKSEIQSNFDRDQPQRKELIQEIKTLVISLKQTKSQMLDGFSTLIEEAKSQRDNTKPH